MATHTIHPFERVGLGVAPFRVVGFEVRTYQACPGAPVQVGACCDFCATGIKNCFVIESADGRRFVVGSDCVRKTADKVLIRGVTELQKEHDRERRAKARAKKHNADMRRIWSAWARFDDVRESLAAEPHPRGFTDRDTGEALTMADWAEWMMANAGTTGRLAVARKIEATL